MARLQSIAVFAKIAGVQKQNSDVHCDSCPKAAWRLCRQVTPLYERNGNENHGCAVIFFETSFVNSNFAVQIGGKVSVCFFWKLWFVLCAMPFWKKSQLCFCRTQ